VTGYTSPGPAWYGTQSRVTDPGPFAGRLDAVPPDLAAMQATARQLVFHYRAGGDYAENGIDPGRIAEIDTRYADAMLARLAELAGPPLTAGRPARQRQPVLFRRHAGLGQHAARGRKADRNLESLGGADQVGRAGAGAQHILDFVEAHVRVGRHQVLDRRTDPTDVLGSIGREQFVALFRVKHGAEDNTDRAGQRCTCAHCRDGFRDALHPRRDGVDATPVPTARADRLWS